MRTMQEAEQSAAQLPLSIEQLWARGRPEDLRAIRSAREAQTAYTESELLRGPANTHFCPAPDAQDADAVAALLEGQYWTQGMCRAELRDAQLGSNVWIVARSDATREVVASARALSDGARLAYVLDVIVRPDLRGTGLGKALMTVLLSHPHVRGVRGLRLRTRDAQAFYQKLGFITRQEPSDEMVRVNAR